jgi:hypothetical protein
MTFLIAAGITLLVLLWHLWRREYRDPSYVDPESKEGELQRRRLRTRFLVLIVAFPVIFAIKALWFHVDRGSTLLDAEPEDAEVLEQLRIAGADLSRPLELDFYLYFPAEPNAKAARDALLAEGFVAKVEFASGVWSCRASKTMIATLETIEAISEQMDALATKHSGEYDGWGAALPEVE